ncbi:inositol polyphosphate 5-phosphatase [Mortierella sp. GBA30]|nr:inositol polyphosphate 5-phosphatase [Mortierella sp. GBA30]
MQSEVYLSLHGQSIRTIALRPCSSNRLDAATKQGQILYFSPHDQPSASGRSQVSVRLEGASEFQQTAYRKLHGRPVFGCLGLMHHANDTFIALVTGCVKVGDIRLGESVYRIVAVKFFSLSGNTPDEDMIPAPYDPETANENEGPAMMPHPCRELEKVLCNGAFFFSQQFDLTRSIQARALKMQEKHVAEANMNYDETFLWNYFMLKELLTYRSHLDEQEREELDYGGLLVKGGNYDQVQSLLQHVRGDSERYGYFYHDLLSNTIVQTQRGVFRTNCLDCLDRTNVIQSNLSKEALECLLHNLLPQDSRFGSLMMMHSELWANNGDMLSKIYTGTGALKSEVTRSGKMSFASMLGDATKSINRFYINNFQDKDRQEVIDVLLGKMAHQVPVSIHDPVHDSIASEMKARLNEYSQQVQIDVFIGTYNLNGKAPSGESLEAWLCFDKDVPEPDLYVIGFQEIVKLTPKQIMATDENKRRVWEQEVERTINRRGGSRYIQLRSGQLVGAALMIYVKEENAPFIRNVECSIKKTGMGGMAGNKGAVAIRMDYYESTLCLVTSHLASGQDNLQERNNDFHTINDGISFARGRTISSHDIILWCGDFNYRVDMENDQIRALVSQGNYFEIFRCDQLKRSIDYGEAFYGYKEGIIAFAPTYRYDIGTDNYDTSEKYRAPAWTDRILYRGRGVYQTSYERAEFRTSDHRPELTMLDSAAKDRMEQTLYRKSSSRSLADGLLKDNLSRKDAAGLGHRGLIGVNSEKLRNGFTGDSSDDQVPRSSGPKPSSDTHQWWNDPLEEGVQRIPSNNRNPFEGDRTIKESTKAGPNNAVPSPRPAPAPPISLSTKKQHTVDLLGDLSNEQISAPVLSLTGKSAGRLGNNPLISTDSIKRSAPPPPVNRRRVGRPASTLPASSIIHKDTDVVAARRPAPPPPKRNADGVVGTSMDDTDDDNSDDDDDDDDDDGDAKDDVDNAVAAEAKAKQPVTAKDANTLGKNEQEQFQETLLKPSQLKNKQQALYPSSTLSTSSASSTARASNTSSVAKNKDVESIQPNLSTCPSSPVSSSNSSSTPVPLATVAANKSKVLLPGFDARGGNNASHKGPTIVSMGLGLSSAGITSPTASKSSGASISGGSVLQRTKDFSTKQNLPAASALPASPSIFVTLKDNNQDKDKDKDEVVSEESEAAPAMSVSELKKSFGAASPSAHPVSIKSTPPIIPVPKISAASKDLGVNKSNSLNSGGAVTPVVPMVKPLSFSPSGLPSRSVSSAASAGGNVKASPSNVSVSKGKIAGLGSSQPASVTKPSTGVDALAKGLRNNQTQDDASEDVKPASGSVKQAIAALKGNQIGDIVVPTKAVGPGTEDAEEEKVDAFAYWKSK